MIYGFDERLGYSRGVREDSDIDTLKRFFPDAISISKTDEMTDRQGIDYIATMRKYAEILVDAKTRDKGCSRFWGNGAELALEIWSVRPGGRFNTPKLMAKTGWTLCEKKNVDYILFTYDPKDTEECFLLPYQLLREVFKQNLSTWCNKFKVDIQQSKTGTARWESQCVFVPFVVVEKAITDYWKLP